MMSCKTVAMLMSTGELADAPLGRRGMVAVHLAMCRHCAAFRRQLRELARGARAASQAFEQELPARFEWRWPKS